PALLHRTCTLPNRSIASFARFCTDASLETSVTTPCTSNSCWRSLVTAASSAGASMSPRTTFMPSCAHRVAIARPIPLAQPVTTATLPSNSSIVPSVFPHQVSVDLAAVHQASCFDQRPLVTAVAHLAQGVLHGTRGETERRYRVQHEVVAQL